MVSLHLMECKQSLHLIGYSKKGTVLSMYQNNWIMSLKSKRKFNSGKQGHFYLATQRQCLSIIHLEKTAIAEFYCQISCFTPKNKHQNYSIGNTHCIFH